MNVPTAIKLLLDRINTRKQFVGGTFGAFDGTAGTMYLQQKDFNASVIKWRETGDTDGLKQLTAGLHMYGNLTDTEYEQIMKALDGEK
jgi:hypothetical protein